MFINTNVGFSIPSDPLIIALGRTAMNKIYETLWRLRIWTDSHGQDLIEYALMAGFVAVAGGAIFPPVADNISTIYSKITSSMSLVGTQS